MPVEHHIGYVYGVRWAFECTPDYIKGGYRGRWYSPRQTARCRKMNLTGVSHPSFTRCSTSPGLNCLCGINMYNMAYILESMQNYSIHRTLGRHAIISIAQGWGKVIEHAFGYRVQKALLTLTYCSSRREYELISQMPGFKKRGVKLTRNAHEFLDTCKELHEKETLTKIPTKEALHGTAR